MPDKPGEDLFGFAAAARTARESTADAVKDRIRQIKPAVPVHDPGADLGRVDAVADSAGFVSREAPPPDTYVYRTGRTQRPEPRIPLNMRVPVTLGAAFQRFCEENRYSYPEALAEVMRRAGLPTR